MPQDPLSIIRKYQQAQPAGRLVPMPPQQDQLSLPGEQSDPLAIIRKYQGPALPPQLEADLSAAALATPPRGGFQPIEPFPVEKILQDKGQRAYEAAPGASRIYETMVAAAAAMGIPEENVLDILKTRMQEGVLPALGKAGEDIVRGPLSLLPGISRRDPGPEARAAAQARQVAGFEKLKEEPLSRGIPQAIGGLAGMIGPLGAVKAPLLAAGGRAASVLASPTAQTIVGKVLPSAAGFAGYSAGMESEVPGATPTDVLKAAGRGATIDLALQGSGRVARALLGQGAVREAVAQGAALTGINELLGKPREESTGDRLERLGYESVINTATMGAARAMGRLAPGQTETARPSRPKTLAEMEADTTVPEVPLPTIERYGTGTAIGPKQLNDPQRVARAMDVDRALLAGQSPQAPRPTTGNEVAPVPEIAVKAPRHMDPGFTAVLKGSRAAYLDPKGTALTANERAFRAAGLKNLPGIERAETSVGNLHFRRDVLDRIVAEDPALAPLAVRDPLTGALDVRRTVDAAAKKDVLGALLQYGAGNESKVGGTHTVTGRGPDGAEIATIIAKNPASAEAALRQHHGAVRVEVKPLAQGVKDILRERGGRKEGPVVRGPVKPELPPQTGPMGKLPGRRPGGKPPTPQPLPGLDAPPTKLPGGRESGALNLSPTPDSPAGKLISWAREFMEEKSDLGTQFARPQYRQVMEDPALHKAAIEAAVTGEASANIASVYAARIHDALKEPWKLELFGRMLVSEQHDGLIRQGRSPAGWLRLTPKQNALIQRHKAEFDQAEAAWKDLLDYIKSDEQMAGIQSYRPARVYAKMVPIRSEKHADELIKLGEKESRQTILVDPQDVTIPGAGPGAAGPGMAKFKFANRFRNRKAQASKMASGQGTAYSIDPLDMARDMVHDRLYAANHMRFKGEVLRYEVKPDENGIVPRMAEFPAGSGKMVPTKFIDIERQPAYIEAAQKNRTDPDSLERPTENTNSIAVPEPVAQAWRRYLNPPEFGGLHWTLDKVQNFNTRAALISGGGDLTFHALNTVGALSTIPGLAKTPAEKAMLATGITRSLLAMKKGLEVHDKDFQKDLIEMYRVGGLRGRHDNLGGFEDKLPILGPLKKSVFGITGGENRMRVAAFRAIRDLDPNLSSAQIVDYINDVFGTYSKALSPELVRYSMGIGFDPFIRPGLAAIKTGVKTIAPFWKDPITGKRRYGTSASFVLGTYATLAGIQAAIDEKHRFPWQIPGLRPWHLRVGDRDVPVTQLLSPATHRGLRHSGMDRFVEDLENGDGVSKATGDAVFGVVNSIVGRAGPFYRTVLAGATGSAPYMTQTPEGGVRLLQITDPNTRTPLLERAKAAATSFLFPSAREQLKLLDQAEQNPVSPAQQGLEGVLKYFALLPPKARSERIAEGAPVRREKAALDAVTRSVVLATDDMTGSAQELSKLPREEQRARMDRRVKRIQELLKERVPDEDYPMALKGAFDFLRGHMKSIEKSAEMAGQK